MPLDKAKIRTSFAQASNSYDAAAELQRTIANELLNQLNTLNGTVLDIGCGTGFLTQALQTYQPEQLIALDIALPMLNTARKKLDNSVHYVCADAEALPFAKNSIDMILSNVALQWCSDKVFQSFHRVLKPNGQLLFSTFAPHTLFELKTAWQNVDEYSHVNEFYTAEQLTDFLKQAGFTNITIKQTSYTRYYDSVLALMRELKHIGAHHVQQGRNRHITTKTAMQQMIKHYEQQFGQNQQIPASYKVFIINAI